MTWEYLGAGALSLLAYVIISNFFWLLFGSAIVQRLPGVHITGARGIAKIACMLICSFVALSIYLFSLLLYICGIFKLKRTYRYVLMKCLNTTGKILPF